jgi:hypothetical protein
VLPTRSRSKARTRDSLGRKRFYRSTKNSSGPVPPGFGSQIPNGLCPSRDSVRVLPDGPRCQPASVSRSKTVSHYNKLSNAGVGALVGGTAGLWLLSYPCHNEYCARRGLLAGEAALNNLVAVEAFKYTPGREGHCRRTAAGSFFRERHVVSVRTHRRRGWRE